MKPTQSAPVLILLIALAGCGDPGASNSSEASNIPSWQAPDAYEFTLDSSCGERSLIGKFRVVVENGSVVEAEGLDESGRALFEHGAEDDVPTLSKLPRRKREPTSSRSKRPMRGVLRRSTSTGTPTRSTTKRATESLPTAPRAESTGDYMLWPLDSSG
jgi:hypothetical protein